MINKALVYKVQDYQESSKLLFIYTEYGKYTLVVKGAKNYKNSFFHLADYLNLIEVELDLSKSMQTLKKGKLLNDYENLKNNYDSFKIVSKILNIIDKLLVNIDNEDKIFNLVLKLLEYKNLSLGYVSFLVKLTYALGYRLTFKQEQIKGFSLALGRTINKDEDLSIDLNVVETAYLKLVYYAKEEPEIEDKYINRLFGFIKEYYIYHLDYNLDRM